MRHRSRFLGAFVAISISTASIIAGVVAASPASAATSSIATPTFITGGFALPGLGLTQSSVDAVSATSSGLDTTLDWFQPASIGTQFDSDHVRQGAALDPIDSYSRTLPGTMIVNWTLKDLSVGWPSYGPFDIGTIGLSAVGTCNLLVGGGAYVCHLESVDNTIADSNPSPGPFVRAKLSADLTITPQGLTSLRTASLGANPGGTANLSLGESPITDALSIPCTAVEGDHVGYSLGTLSTTPGVTVQTNLQLEVGTSIENPAYPATSSDPVLYQPASAAPTFPVASATTSIAMTGTGETTDLGAVQQSDLPPVAVPGGPYSGTEGTPIAFDGSASSSGCGPDAPALHWQFSDGGSADGPTPQHTFVDDGTYSATLTATDSSGTTASTSFSVHVANVAPTADAGADVNTDWGHVVTFAGHGTDPSSVDQTSLQYSWNFGDGTPVASSSTGDASHVYSGPGANGYYNATLTVCDKDGACSSDVRRVAATKRTYLLYFGDFIGRANTSVDLRALVVDQTGAPVRGRTVTFQFGTQSVTAITDSRGVATTTVRPSQRAGLYALNTKWTPSGPDVGVYSGASMTVPFLLFPR